MSLLRFQDPDDQVDPELRVAAPVEPDPSDVERLRAVVGFPLVSLIVATTPGAALGCDDIVRLAAMLAEVEHRLRREVDVHAAVELADRCRATVIDLLDEPTGHGLAVFVGAQCAEAFRLPHRPVDRVVIDPTFATRELELAVRLSPRCRVVVLGTDAARMYLVDRGSCVERSTASFPVAVPPRRSRIGTHLERVASGLAGDQGTADLPLVLVGPRLMTLTLAKLVGVEPLAMIDRRMPDLGSDAILAIARSAMASAAGSECDRAFDRLDDAAHDGVSAIGLDAVWDAALDGTIELVVVDREFSRAAIVDPTSGTARWVDDPSATGVIDDVVDELIELTRLAGGDVVFVNRGELGPDQIAAVRRTATHPFDPACLAGATR